MSPSQSPFLLELPLFDSLKASRLIFDRLRGDDIIMKAHLLVEQNLASIFLLQMVSAREQSFSIGSKSTLKLRFHQISFST